MLKLYNQTTHYKGLLEIDEERGPQYVTEFIIKNLRFLNMNFIFK